MSSNTEPRHPNDWRWRVWKWKILSFGQIFLTEAKTFTNGEQYLYFNLVSFI
jgi:hypothetical protein